MLLKESVMLLLVILCFFDGYNVFYMSRGILFGVVFLRSWIRVVNLDIGKVVVKM